MGEDRSRDPGPVPAAAPSTTPMHLLSVSHFPQIVDKIPNSPTRSPSPSSMLPSSLCGTGWWASACFVLAVIKWLTHLGEKRPDRQWVTDSPLQQDHYKLPHHSHAQICQRFRSEDKGLVLLMGELEDTARNTSCPEPTSCLPRVKAPAALQGPHQHRSAHSLFLLLLPCALQVVSGHIDETCSLVILWGTRGPVHCLPWHRAWWQSVRASPLTLGWLYQ